MILILLTIALGIVSGISEGMVMHFPGVRDHADFWLYHFIDVLAYALCAWLAIRLWEQRRRTIKYALMVIGLAFLLWETRELGYAIARYASWRGATENVYGLGITASGHMVTVLHAVRSLLSLGCIIGGSR